MSYFIKGPINQNVINNINSFNEKSNISGANVNFCGIVRADKLGNKIVEEIEYSYYGSMAEQEMKKIHDNVQKKYEDVNNISILHSIESVKTGEISLFVLVESGHRVSAFEACHEIVDLIKANVPIWKKEKYTDGTYTWHE